MKNIRAMGARWEREVARRLKGKRQPSSGAFGTQHNLAGLTGDVVTKLPWLNKSLHLECKYGYGGSKSMTIKREWFTKVREEAANANRLPAVAIKFKGVTGGDIESASLICFNLDTWERITKELNYLYEDYLGLLEAQFKEQEDGDG